MRGLRLIVGTSSLAIMAMTAGQAAAQVDEAGADEIRRGVENYITQYLVTGPESEVTLQGDVEVTAEGDHYAVTLPTFIFGLQGPQLVVDPILATLTPTADDLIDVTWTMPSRYEVGAGGQTMATMSIDAQTAEGTFAPAFETFTDLNFVLERIELRPTQEEGAATVDTFSMVMDTEEVAPDRFDADFDVVLAGLDVDPGQQDGVLSLDEIGLAGSISHLDMREYTMFGQQLNQLMSAADMENPRGPDPMVFGDIAALLRETPNLFSDMDLTYRLHGLNFGDGQEGAQLGSASAGMYVTGLDQPAGTIGFHADMNELAIQPTPPFNNILPQEVRAEVMLVDLPNEQLLNLLIDFLEQTSEMGPDMAGTMFMVGLQQAVMQSGASLEVPEIYVDLGVSEINFTGTVSPTASSPLGVVADATLTVSNMAGLIGELQAMGPMGQDVVQGLTVLQTMGEVSQTGEGQSLHSYHFQATDAGQVLLNGNDMGPMMGQLMQ